MKKLILELNDLRVETFQTSADTGARGTVMGHAPTVNGHTCGYSCPNTCGIVPNTQDCRGLRPTDDCPVCA